MLGWSWLVEESGIAQHQIIGALDQRKSETLRGVRAGGVFSDARLLLLKPIVP